MNPHPSRLIPLLMLLALLAAACSPHSPAAGTTSPPSQTGAGTPAVLRLGYLPQLTQATALVGFQDGVFAQSAGPGVTIQPVTTFATAAQESAALSSGAVDAAYLDPNAAITAFQASNGGVKIIAGAAVGGSFLMTKYIAIKDPANLRGAKIATPEVGNDQDVVLRAYLIAKGLNPNPGGNVTIIHEPGPSILQQYKAGQITGAWVDEEWATRLQIEAGATVFVDEASLWANGAYPTAVLAVRSDYLRAHPDAVTGLLIGQVHATDLLATQSPQIQNDAATALRKLVGVNLTTPESELAGTRITYTNDPIASAVTTDASNAQHVGLLKSGNIAGIFDLGPLNQILQAIGRPTIAGG